MSLLPPEPVRSAYAAWQWSIAWEWPHLATTWRLEESGGAIRFLKVVVSGHYPTALAEAERMTWARPYLPVPEVVGCGSDDAVDWLATRALPGVDASRHPLSADPDRLVTVLARGLAAFHDAAPVDECPFDFRVPAALAHVRRRIRSGVVKGSDLHPEHGDLAIDAALEHLEHLAPRSEDLVVCHGDYCFPNVLLDGDGALAGYVDLGELAVADRWWDITVGAWSTTWNVGPGWEHRFYEAYGVDADDPRIRFYRLLYDLAS